MQTLSGESRHIPRPTMDSFWQTNCTPTTSKNGV